MKIAFYPYNTTDPNNCLLLICKAINSAYLDAEIVPFVLSRNFRLPKNVDVYLFNRYESLSRVSRLSMLKDLILKALGILQIKFSKKKNSSSFAQ